MEPYRELEQKYAIFTGAAHAVSCNSGTSALHLALLALGVGVGDEVIVPDFAMGAVAFAVSYCGAIPVFADVDLDTYALTAFTVEKLITDKTKAVIAVHTYGRLAPIDDLYTLLNKRNIALIEDACEAQGAVQNSKADLTCWSFYRNKIIAAEEGGMVTTNDEKLATKMRYFKNMAFNEQHDYFHEHVGYNYRMPNSQAKLALVSLHMYARHAFGRRRVEQIYDSFIPDHLPAREAVWFYEVVGNKDAVARIPGARHAFKPLSSFPMYGASKGLPNARALSNMLILLPVRPDMPRQEIKAICDML